jgi:hypothetical protein
MSWSSKVTAARDEGLISSEMMWDILLAWREVPGVEELIDGVVAAARIRPVETGATRESLATYVERELRRRVAELQEGARQLRATASTLQYHQGDVVGEGLALGEGAQFLDQAVDQPLRW